MPWSDVGKQESLGNDLIKLEGKKRLRLLIPETGPKSFWTYAIETPDGAYRSWVSPVGENDIFALNRNIFKAKPRHAGLAYDYEEKRVGILEAGNQVWQSLKDLIDEGIDIRARDITIVRKGEGRTTEYTVIYHDKSTFDVALDEASMPNIEMRYAPMEREAIMASLSELGFPQPEEIFTLKPLSKDAAMSFEMPFGKYAGRTMKDIYMMDDSYLLFLAAKSNRHDVKEVARVIANSLLGTNYAITGVAPAMEEISYTAPKKNKDDDIETKQATPKNEPSRQDAPKQDKSKNGKQSTKDNTKDSAKDKAVSADGINREEHIKKINKVFESNPKYMDFMKIIETMHQATQPNPKTLIADFTDEELKRLYLIVAN